MYFQKLEQILIILKKTNDHHSLYFPKLQTAKDTVK